MKEVWVTKGGAELPVTNLAAAMTILLAGPGALSLDRALKVRLPRWVAPVGLAAVGAAVAFGMRRAEESHHPREEAPAEEPTVKETDEVIAHLPVAAPHPADLRDIDNVVPAAVRAASGSSILSAPPGSAPELSN